MSHIMEKALRKSEITYTFIAVDAISFGELPNQFELVYDGKVFNAKINKARRIALYPLFDLMKPQIGDIIALDKLSDQKYQLKLKRI